MITLIIPGAPVGKARARTVRLRNGRVLSFTPQKTANKENFIRTIFAAEYPNHVPTNQPIAMSIRAYMEIPKSISAKRRALLALESTPHVHRPDADNCAKLCLDALNRIAFLDDSQIYALEVCKFYSLRPRLEIEIHEIDDLTSVEARPALSLSPALPG